MDSTRNHFRCCVVAWALAFGLALVGSADALTITEIMYHPPEGSENLEYIEIHNETGDPVDITGYHFSSGVRFVFEERRFLEPFGYVVVCADAGAVRAAYGIDNAVGDWDPETALSNGGEAVTLVNSAGVVEASVRYNDRGKWPAGADGAGHSLALVDVYTRLNTSASWALSGARGGSPGVANDTGVDALPVFVNEVFALPENAARWVELYNAGDEEIDLSGFHLSTDRDALTLATLTEKTILPPRGWISFEDGDLLLDFSPDDSGRVYVVLSTPGGSRVVDAVSVQPATPGASVARVPDGARDFEPAALGTRDAANETPARVDIVINEIHYHPLDNDPSSEFVELYNRGDEVVAIGGWRFTDGIDFDFALGTSVAPGEYLVVARDPMVIQERYGLSASQVVGPQSAEALDGFGTLSDRGERLTLEDELGNRVDTVRYADGGEWPAWADGDGSSLELIDAFQENSTGQAWDASDDSGKAEVAEFEYRGRNTTAGAAFRLALGDTGIALVDDIVLAEPELGLDDARVIVDFPGTWRFHKGRLRPSDPETAWREIDFDDSSWETSAAPFGYGNDDEGTLLDDMRGAYFSVFFRLNFEVDEDNIHDDYLLDVTYDDGFVAYLNGQEIDEDNVPDTRSFGDAAVGSRDRTRTTVITGMDTPLVVGTNVLAIQVHNTNLSSNDFRFAARLRSGRLADIIGPNHLADGDFDMLDEDVPEWPAGSTNPHWLISGNHIRSGRTTVDPLSGDGSLRIVATGKGDNKVNRIKALSGQVDGLQPLRLGSTALVSFRARWVIGTPVLLTHGDYSRNLPPAYAASHLLRVPERLGTPGAENSVTARQRSRDGSVNLGPLISGVGHMPIVPLEREEVTVRATVYDPDGVEGVTLHYATGRPRDPADPELVALPMEGPDADGVYRVTVPGHEAGTVVVCFITARDTVGRSGRFPLDHVRRTHPLVSDPANPTPEDRRYLIYMHEESPAPPDPDASPVGLSYRFWFHDGVEEYLGTRMLLSNDLVHGTMVFEGRDAYYNAGIRFSGSPWARQRWFESYRVRMPKDNPLNGRVRRFGLEDHQGAGGRDARERLSNYLLRHNQGGTRVPFFSQHLVRFQLSHRLRNPQFREHVVVPNRDFLADWYPGDSDGPFFEMDDRHTISDAGSRVSSLDGNLLYPPYGAGNVERGEDREEYRFYFTPRGKNTRDDFSQFIELAKVMTPEVTPDEEFDELIWDTIDVEEFLRVWAVRMNTDDWDTWGTDRGKNCYLYQPPGDGRWVLLPWDMELTYGSTSSFLPPRLRNGVLGTFSTKFTEVRRFMNRPEIMRLYLGILKEMVDTSFSSEFLAPYMEELDTMQMTATGHGKEGGFVDRRAALIRLTTDGISSEALDLTITSNGGLDWVSDAARATLQGIAPIDARSLGVVINGRDVTADFAVAFDTPTEWVLSGPLSDGGNEIHVLGLDVAGEVLTSDSVVVTVVTEDPDARFLRGDANVDGRINLSDVFWTLAAMNGEVFPACLDAMDTDDSGELDLVDVLVTLEFLFQGGAPPPPPFPGVGVDPTSGDALGCLRGVF